MRRTFWPSIRNFRAAAGANGGCAIRPSENLCMHRVLDESMGCGGCSHSCAWSEQNVLLCTRAESSAPLTAAQCIQQPA